MAGPPVIDSKPLGVVFIHVALTCDMTELHVCYIVFLFLNTLQARAPPKP